MSYAGQQNSLPGMKHVGSNGAIRLLTEENQVGTVEEQLQKMRQQEAKKNEAVYRVNRSAVTALPSSGLANFFMQLWWVIVQGQLNQDIGLGTEMSAS